MPQMTDPLDALASFQEMLPTGTLDLQQGEFDSDLYVHADNPNGKSRLTYVKLDENMVTAFTNFVLTDPVEGTPCFSIGYAVPERFRKEGRAKQIVRAAIEELKGGLGRSGIKSFYIEAIVGKENLASQGVAKAVISSTSKSITDEFSGKAAYQYLLKVDS